MVENWQADDRAWPEENLEKEKGCFTRYGSVFVPTENLLERALEDVSEDSFLQKEFVEKALDLIEKQPELQEVFLKWFYKDYGEEN